MTQEIKQDSESEICFVSVTNAPTMVDVAILSTRQLTFFQESHMMEDEVMEAEGRGGRRRWSKKFITVDLAPTGWNTEQEDIFMFCLKDRMWIYNSTFHIDLWIANSYNCFFTLFYRCYVLLGGLLHMLIN